MKKTVLFAALILLLTVCLGCCAHAETKTTVLVYMCASDMEEEAYMDLDEMLEAETGKNTSVVVLAGGVEYWEIEELEGDALNLVVIRDGDVESLEVWGRGSMGDADTLAEFLEYGMTEYPAERTVVILWDHGAGSEGGICFDDTADGDGLTVLEIDSALRKARKAMGELKIDVFGCDACMMATYEMAAMLSHYDIDCFVASQEMEPAEGWEYSGWLEALDRKPGMTNEELCGLIAKGFMGDGMGGPADEYMTISAVSLPAVRDLEKSMEDFAACLTQALESGDLAAIRRGRSRIYTFGSFCDGSWDMVDLGAALDAFAQLAPESAAQARRHLNQAVIVKRQTEDLDPCSGLSVLIPQDTVDEFDEYSDGINLSAYIPNWVDFVNGYAGMVAGGHYSFTASAPKEVAGTDTITGWLDSFGFLSGAAYGWNDQAQAYEETWETEKEYAVSDSDHGFTARLSQEDLQYLDYVEGMLLLDMSDEDAEAYVDFGTMQNNLVDWKTGDVYSLFDGTWPVLAGQPVPLYDQSSNEQARRSLVPVKLNGEPTYLVVMFDAGSTEGRIIGANAGYDDSGLPIRKTTKLREGDEIIPIYTVFYAENEAEDFEEMEFEGDPILWKEGMTVNYEELGDGDEPMEVMFCFVFNDIFGDYTMSEFISFEV